MERVVKKMWEGGGDRYLHRRRIYARLKNGRGKLTEFAIKKRRDEAGGKKEGKGRHGDSRSCFRKATGTEGVHILRLRGGLGFEMWIRPLDR